MDSKRQSGVSTITFQTCAEEKRTRVRSRQGGMASHSLGQVEAYLTVREILAEASKAADGVHWCEFNGFGR